MTERFETWLASGLFVAVSCTVSVAGAGTDDGERAKLYERLESLERRIERESRAGRRLRKRIDRLDRRLAGGSGESSVATRARERVGRALARHLANWSAARRRERRARAVDPEPVVYGPLLASARRRALEGRRGPVASFRRLEQKLGRSGRISRRRARLAVRWAGRRSAERAVRAERRALVDGIGDSEEDAQRVRRAIEETEKKLEKALGSFFEHAPGRDFHRKKGQLARPVVAQIDRGFGRRPRERSSTYVRHTGLTYRVDPGTVVHSIAGGIVVYADRFEGYGRTVIIDHGGGYHSVYAHLRSIGVRPGQRVERAEVIARTGSSGSLEGPKLYFELRRDGRPIDPRPWLIHD
ncbi:MAG: murein hydrolase activator EnvC [Bradymonadaceae bacterium]